MQIEIANKYVADLLEKILSENIRHFRDYLETKEDAEILAKIRQQIRDNYSSIPETKNNPY